MGVRYRPLCVFFSLDIFFSAQAIVEYRDEVHEWFRRALGGV